MVVDPFTELEVRKAIFDMRRTKRFPGFLRLKIWDLVNKHLLKVVICLFNGVVSAHLVNFTWIILIPKVEDL